uniref:Uncharacterized protein n=1 Tax=Glossina austeni TaxID=7395 RepID=A0A1A9UZ71_GLOAU
MAAVSCTFVGASSYAHVLIGFFTNNAATTKVRFSDAVIFSEFKHTVRTYPKLNTLMLDRRPLAEVAPAGDTQVEVLDEKTAAAAAAATAVVERWGRHLPPVKDKDAFSPIRFLLVAILDELIFDEGIGLIVVGVVILDVVLIVMEFLK